MPTDAGRAPTGRPRSPARALPARALPALALVAALVLGGCSSSGQSLARQACDQVDASLSLLTEAHQDGSSAEAAHDRSQATADLARAQALAAQASLKASKWKALDFTLSQSGQVPEPDLVQALTSECAAVKAPANQPPPPPADVGGPPAS